MQPHRIRYWLDAKPDARKDERIADICTLCQQAPNGPDELVMSTDEMTAIQALERIAPDLAMSPGKPVAVEFVYKRHGTQTLIAAIHVATATVCGWGGGVMVISGVRSGVTEHGRKELIAVEDGHRESEAGWRELLTGRCERGPARGPKLGVRATAHQAIT